MYWHKRSNTTWLLEGDNNSGFFHRVANDKKRKNTIFHLENEGEVITGDEEIVKQAINYYKNLFGPSNDPMFSMDPSCWVVNEKVSDVENEMLIRNFSEEEIKNAIFSMETNTALGPDHIPIEFFQTC